MVENKRLHLKQEEKEAKVTFILKKKYLKQEASSDARKQELGKQVKAGSCYYTEGEVLHLKQEPYGWQKISRK